MSQKSFAHTNRFATPQRSALCAKALGSIPAQFFEGVLRILFRAYRQALVSTSADFGLGPEAHYLNPHLRRALIEKEVRTLAEGTPGLEGGVAGRWGSAHTTLMTRGLILTLAYVPSPDTLLRPAAYRRNYAESNMNLFCPAEAPLERTYGILLHGGASMNRRPPREPTFARVVFPDASLRTYHQDYIDLFREFSHIVETLQKRDFVPVEVVPDNVQFELMPQQKEKRQA